MNKKKIILILIILLMVIISVKSAIGYCNETRTITHTNQSLASSDYTSSITKTCTEEYNNFSFITPIIVLLFLATLCIIGLFTTEQIWVKVVLVDAMAIIITGLFRFCSWFINITNPGESGLISTLDMFYAWGVRSLYLLIFCSILFLVVFILNLFWDMSKNKRQKKDQEWDRWGRG